MGDFIHLIEVRADEYFPVTQLRWSGEITPTCPPVFGSCGYHGSGGGTLTNPRTIIGSTAFEVKQLTWWADASFGYVKLVMTVYDEDKNRAAATAGKFPDFDYLRVAWGEAARDDPHHPDFKFGPDETEPNPFGVSGAGGRYNSVNNDVTFLWKIGKSEYSDRGLKFAGNHYPIYVRLEATVEITAVHDSVYEVGEEVVLGFQRSLSGITEQSPATTTVTLIDNDARPSPPSQASLPAEATPRAAVALDFAHFANGTGITSEMVLVNVAAQPVRPAIDFYDKAGGLIDPESVVEVTVDLEVAEDGSLSVLTEMEPLGVLTISTHGRGELVSGSVKVVSDGPLGGLVRYSIPEIGVAGVGASEPVRDVLFPARRQEGGIRTAAALHNLGAEAMGVNCRLMSGGVALEEAEIPLEANGQASWFIEDAFTATDTSDFLGSVRCTAPGNGRFTAVALEMDAANRIFTTLPVVPVDPPGSGNQQTTLDFAHFANGTGITSEMVFLNPSTQPSRPAVYFYDTEGALVAPDSVVDLTGDLEITEDGALTVWTEIEPLGELTISTHGRGELVTGSVRVVSDGPIGGLLRFDLPGVGAGVVGASPPLGDALFPVRRQEGGINTWAAIHNLESSPGLVRCDLMREGVLLDAVSIPLEANWQTSWFIDQAFPAADTSDFAGSVRCDAVGEGRFSAVALEMDPGNRIFTTLPVVPVPEMPSQE